MRAVIYSFAKKMNSTKQVSGSGTEIEVTLKWDGCGIVKPLLIVDYGLTTAPVNFNYVSIPDFKRYYFVDDWVFVNGTWHASLTTDVLATWKSDILNKELFVIRSAHTWNGSIIDMERVATAAVERHWIFGDFDYTSNPANGAFIVGLSGKTSHNTMGCVQYYSLNQQQMFELCSKLLQSTDWLDINWDTAGEFLTNDIVKCLLNPLQYIVSCHWIPWKPSSLVTQSGQLPVGWWSISLNDMKVVPAGNTISKTYTIEINHHPKEFMAAWVQRTPYTQYNLFIPLVGMVTLDPADIVGYNHIMVQYILDVITGDCSVKVLTKENAAIPYSKVLRTFNVSLAVKIPLSQITSDVYSAAMSTFNGVVDISGKLAGAVGQALSVGGEKGYGLANIIGAAHDATLGTAKTFVNTVGDAVTSLMPKVETIGETGSWARFKTDTKIILECVFMDITEIDIKNMGAPECAVHRLSELQGYCICKTGNIDIAAMGDEQAMIEHYITTGFYIE